MATTLKKVISPYFLQYKEQYLAIKFQFLQNFSQIYGNYNIPLQTIFWTTPHFLTLGVTVPNTINTHKFFPQLHTWLKIQIPSQSFVTTFGISKLLSTFHCFFPSRHCIACIALQIVSLKTHYLITAALAQAPRVLGQK